MAKCAKCQKRKAKRDCPALARSLCSLCCGQLRQKEVFCPPACPFLEKHESYQEKRTIERQQSNVAERLHQERDILKDERMAWLAIHIEAPLKAYAERETSLTDKNALLALEYAKDKIEKGKGLIIFDGQESRPTNSLGEAIIQSAHRCRYEKRIILPGEHQAYSAEEKLKCLDRIILSVQYFAGESYDQRRYLQKLLNRFQQLEKMDSKFQITR
jgi:hypothetical protein